MDRHSHYDWLAEDQTYRKKYDDALQEYADGVQGLVGKVLRSADHRDILLHPNLLMFEGKRVNPEYRDNVPTFNVNVDARSVIANMTDFDAAIAEVRRRRELPEPE